MISAGEARALTEDSVRNNVISKHLPKIEKMIKKVIAEEDFSVIVPFRWESENRPVIVEELMKSGFECSPCNSHFDSYDWSGDTYIKISWA